MSQSSRFEFSRGDRVRKAIMREMGDMILRTIKDPRLANEVVSVTDVEVSGDLRHAKIYISVFGDDALKTDVMDILKEWAPRLRTEIGKRIRLHHTPELMFYMDDSLERGSRVTQLLDKINRGEV